MPGDVMPDGPLATGEPADGGEEREDAGTLDAFARLHLDANQQGEFGEALSAARGR